MSTSPFASKSLSSHLVRGIVGFGLLGSGLVLSALVGPVGLVLAPFGLIALRGCPGCWVVGLVATLSNGRSRRVCVDGTCELVPADLAPAADRTGA